MLALIRPFGNNPKTEILFDVQDTWNLDVTLAHIIHASLVNYKESLSGIGYGIGYDEEKLNLAIEAFRSISKEEHMGDNPNLEQIRLGLQAFADIYMTLWD